MNGDVWLGPNAVLAFKREGYKLLQINPADLLDAISFRYVSSVSVCRGLSVCLYVYLCIHLSVRFSVIVVCLCGCQSVYSVFQKKNIPDIFSCNFRKHYRIFKIFGTRVTEKVSNQ